MQQTSYEDVYSQDYSVQYVSKSKSTIMYINGTALQRVHTSVVLPAVLYSCSTTLDLMRPIVVRITKKDALAVGARLREV